METEAKQRPKTNITANILAIISIIIFPIWWFIVSIIWANQKIENGFYILYSGRICGIVAISCGILSLIFVKKIKDFKLSKLVAMLGCFLSVICTLQIPHILSDAFDSKNDRCHMNLWILSTYVKAYCEKHNDEFPDPNKWCDQLLRESQDFQYTNATPWKLSKENFECRANLEARHVYAFNKNLAGKRISEVDPNVVVIFEAKTVGWNQHGDYKIMSSDLHKIILGNSGSYFSSIKQDDGIFVPQSEINNLHWKP
ncbi:MAG: hypothetical protein ABFD79_17415 [Phycisphaerales bacterium]